MNILSEVQLKILERLGYLASCVREDEEEGIQTESIQCCLSFFFGKNDLLNEPYCPQSIVYPTLTVRNGVIVAYWDERDENDVRQDFLTFYFVSKYTIHYVKRESGIKTYDDHNLESISCIIEEMNNTHFILQ